MGVRVGPSLETRLELDLAQLSTAPTRFRER
jgi:hypothetical protein